MYVVILSVAKLLCRFLPSEDVISSVHHGTPSKYSPLVLCSPDYNSTRLVNNYHVAQKNNWVTFMTPVSLDSQASSVNTKVGKIYSYSYYLLIK